MAALAEFISSSVSVEDAYQGFWRTFESNLRERRIRLIFVADAIPSELKTLVEFLNEQMSSVEVFAVEVVQYASRGQRMLRPQLVGQTATARARKDSSKPPQRESAWTGPEIVHRLGEQSPRASEIAEAILGWASKRGDITVEGNRGLFNPRVGLRLSGPGSQRTLCSIWGGGREPVEIPVAGLKREPRFTDIAEQEKLWTDLTMIARWNKADPAAADKATCGPATVKDDVGLTRLISILEDIANRLTGNG